MKLILLNIFMIILFFFTGTQKFYSIKCPVQGPVERQTNKKKSFKNKNPKEHLMEALIYHNVKHPEIVYAQAVLETGNFTSKNCIKYNNLFGLYDSSRKRYYRFNSWEESIIAYKNKVQYKYKENKDYYTFLRDIRYAEDIKYINKVKKIVRQNDKTRIK